MFTHAPVSLLPTPLPREQFTQAYRLADIVGKATATAQRAVPRMPDAFASRQGLPPDDAQLTLSVLANAPQLNCTPPSLLTATSCDRRSRRGGREQPPAPATQKKLVLVCVVSLSQVGATSSATQGAARGDEFTRRHLEMFEKVEKEVRHVGRSLCITLASH